jgi:hypothetical protein
LNTGKQRIFVVDVVLDGTLHLFILTIQPFAAYPLEHHNGTQITLYNSLKVRHVKVDLLLLQLHTFGTI